MIKVRTHLEIWCMPHDHPSRPRLLQDLAHLPAHLRLLVQCPPTVPKRPIRPVQPLLLRSRTRRKTGISMWRVRRGLSARLELVKEGGRVGVYEGGEGREVGIRETESAMDERICCMSEIVRDLRCGLRVRGVGCAEEGMKREPARGRVVRRPGSTNPASGNHFLPGRYPTKGFDLGLGHITPVTYNNHINLGMEGRGKRRCTPIAFIHSWFPR